MSSFRSLRLPVFLSSFPLRRLALRLSVPLFGGLIALAVPPGVAHAAAVRLDPARTRIDFAVGAEGYPLTKGLFRRFSSALSIDFDSPARSRVEFRVAAGSLETGAPVLDSYVRGPAFLNAERFPEVSFVSTAVEKLDDHRVRVSGTFTLLGVSRPESFLVDVARGPGQMLSLTAEGHIHRSDFGMTAGLPLISDDVAISVSTQADAP